MGDMRITLLVLLLVVELVGSAQAPAPAKKRIAVFDFESSGVTTSEQSIFFSTTTPNVGKSVADLLLTRLVQGGKAIVLERAALDRLISEQNFSNSDRADPVTAAKLGRILGVDAIILGSVTHYDYDDKTTGGGGSPLAGFGRVNMSTKHDITARVQVNARIVSTDTAVVLEAVQGAGEVMKKGVKVDIRDTRNALSGGGPGNNNPIMTEATDKAIAQLAGQVEGALPRVPTHVPIVEGLIADVNDSGRLVLNVGSRDGIKVGDRLQVYRPGKEIRDPATGKVLLRDDTLLGEATVTGVNEGSSFAQYAGTPKPQVGDAVKTPPK